MKKQELCQFLETSLGEQYNKLIISNIANYIWFALVKIRILQELSLEEALANSSLNLWVEELKRGVPVQYVVQNSCFFGLDFEVNSNVLIPRSETEELVFWILSDFKRAIPIQVLDIGTGSGCIAITLKNKRNEWSITAIDISLEAIQLAKRNAIANNVEIEFIRIDFLKNKEPISTIFDLIISNPPYISQLEKNKITESILLEPHIALFPVGQDPLIFYKETAIWAKQHLRNSGTMYFELNEFLYEEILEIFKLQGYSKIEIREDLQGKKRMLKVQF